MARFLFAIGSVKSPNGNQNVAGCKSAKQLVLYPQQGERTYDCESGERCTSYYRNPKAKFAYSLMVHRVLLQVVPRRHLQVFQNIFNETHLTQFKCFYEFCFVFALQFVALSLLPFLIDTESPKYYTSTTESQTNNIFWLTICNG